MKSKPKTLVVEKLAALLELSPADLRDRDKVKQSYRRKSRALHPDSNGCDGRAMCELNQLLTAYECGVVHVILSD